MSNEEKIIIDVLIPAYKCHDSLIGFVDRLKKQKNIEIANVIIPLTSSNCVDDAITLQQLKENGIFCFKVDPEYFSHSLTRQRAIKKYCKSDIVVLISQDVYIVDDMSLYNLVKDIYDKKCVYTYGRQLGPKKGIERYIRDKNYPKESFFVSKEDIPVMNMGAFFSSDAFAAIDRNVFIELDGFKDINVSSNEDMLYSYIILMAGYKKKYCADAVVKHYHNLTLKQLYKRYQKTGQFFKQVGLFDHYKKNESGFELAMYVLKQAIKHFDIKAIIRWPFDMGSRFFGLKSGKNNKINAKH